MAKSKPIELLEIKTDGGARGNPGPAGIGVYAFVGKKEIFSLSETIGETTNNVAEYTAVIRALEHLDSEKIFTEKIRFILDSELIVRQITGIYKVKQPHLKELKNKIVDLVKKLREKEQIKLMSFITVPREQNKEADKLVNQALDEK